MPRTAIEPVAAAVASHGAKTPIGSVLRTAEWARVPLALRNKAQFSAGVESARLLQRVQDGIGEILSHSRNENGALTDRSGLIRDLTQLAIHEGLEPVDPAKRGTLQDITSEARAELIVQQQTSQAYGYANWLAGQDEDGLEAAPAQELVRIREANVPRDWRSRWMAAGGRIFPGSGPNGDGRLVALKGDPIWERISRFGNPWPPYDFNSGVWVEDVSRSEAVDMGLITPSQHVATSMPEFNEKLEASVKGLGPELRQALESLFGPQVAIDGDRIQWKGNAHSYEPVTHDQRQAARFVFARSASDLGAVRLGEDGAESPPGISPSHISGLNAAEISAVAAGRKPLFHERVSAYTDPQLVRQLRRHLPPGVRVRSDSDSLYVWNDDLVSRLADPSKPIFDQVRAHADDGLWLGYGQKEWGGAGVRVAILDPQKRMVAGFWTPRDKAELYGAARARDYADATGQPFTYEILE